MSDTRLRLDERHPNKDHKPMQVPVRRKNARNGSRDRRQALCDSLTMHLESELHDRGQAAKLARFITRELLVWKVPTGKLANAGDVIAFSFGNRLLKSGATVPGLVNQRLARVAI